MIRIKSIALLIACMSVASISCVKHEVSFTARSDVESDGAINRKGRLEIRITGDREISADSLQLTQFYEENYVAPEGSLFKISRSLDDSVLAVSWEGTIPLEQLPVSDYIHKSKEGSTAINSITVAKKSRWIYKDITYIETFSDPIDTARYFPMIRAGLSEATQGILDHEVMKGLRDREGADNLLQGIEKEAGLDLFRRILQNPAEFDTVSEIYDERISMVSDSLAGFAGVKQNPDSLSRLIHDAYDAAWDTLLSDHPGIFGSFAFDDIDLHDFTIEVAVPGCLISTNADTTINGVSAWSFNRVEFFARSFTIEVSARYWSWINIAITVVIIAIILFLILGPVRKSRAA
jgi:hypothetical protein